MDIARTLRTESHAQLRRRIVEGGKVDPARIEGYAYRGTSLGQPLLIEKLTWLTFQKTFYRQPSTGRLMGWNVRLEQDGFAAPSRPKRAKGVPVTEWNYEVISPAGVPMPRGFDRGLIIDYGRAPNPRLATVNFVKDPLVSLSGDDCDVLLGVSYAVILGRPIETPSYFVLERDHHIDYVPTELR